MECEEEFVCDDMVFVMIVVCNECGKDSDDEDSVECLRCKFCGSEDVGLMEVESND